ncbi:hypothetical protein EBR43_02255 [bacterium]|nr:hypothetical protein [bacterium]
MKLETFHFEIKDLVTQFVAAFDDIVIKRFDKNRIAQNKVSVRYVYAPKQRVIYDLVNKAQNLTVPVVAINISSVSRDESRVFNKLAGFYLTRGASENDIARTSKYYRSPVPVNVGVSMSFLTKFQTDMDQIISNFVPYNNPYIVISWKVPEGLIPGAGKFVEIRSEVLWDGNISLSYPTDLNAFDKYRIVGDTSFVIKGWLFPYLQGPASNIYQIDSDFNVSANISTYESLSGDTFTYPTSTNLVNETETVSVSGLPFITNVDYI